MSEAEALQRILDASRRVVFFGGAGVSTASGIPDFRSGGGVFSTPFGGLDPETILSKTFFHLHPEVFFDFCRARILHPGARPNAVHTYLAELERSGRLTGVVTQNIDGLHRLAGSVRLFELHGSVLENSCVECAASFPMETVLRAQGLPRCPHCGGLIRPDITLYGEAPPPFVRIGALRVIAEADTLIVAGTSLAVEPAASMPDNFRGRHLVVINRTPTPLDHRAELVLRGDVAEIFAALRV